MKNPVFDIDNWKEITATLSRNKTRTFLTAFGIFWGTAMLAMLWGGAQGLQDMLSRQFAGFAQNSGVIFPNATSMPYKGYAKGMSWSLTLTDVTNLRNRIPEMTASTSMASKSTTAKYNDKTQSTELQGVEPGFEYIMSPIIHEGRFINEADLRERKKVCVIGKKVAEQLFGSESPVGKYIEADNIYYRIVGVGSQRSEVSIGSRVDDSLFIPITTAQSAYNYGNKIFYFVFALKKGVSPTSLLPKIERVIRSNHPIHPDDRQAIEIMDVSEMFEMVSNVFMGVDILVLFVGMGSLLAGIIGVGNIMWIIVKERTQEIGIRRAIGAKPRDIIMQILSESVVLTIVAGVAGICFAVLVLLIAAHVTAEGDDVPGFQLTFMNAVWILVTFLTLGTAAGTIPALKAMNIKPIEALNDK